MEERHERRRPRRRRAPGKVHGRVGRGWRRPLPHRAPRKNSAGGGVHGRVGRRGRAARAAAFAVASRWTRAARNGKDDDASLARRSARGKRGGGGVA